VKIGRVRLAGIERDDHAFVLEIDFYILHAFDFHKRSAQPSRSLMVILPFGGDLNGFQDGVIGAFREKRIGWIWVSWSCRIHRFSLSNVRRQRSGCLLHAVIFTEVKDLTLDDGSPKLNCVGDHLAWGPSPSARLGMTR
jgi:hypothetical protein